MDKIEFVKFDKTFQELVLDLSINKLKQKYMQIQEEEDNLEFSDTYSEIDDFNNFDSLADFEEE